MTNIVDLPKQSLAITVWDHNKGKQNDYIGKGLCPYYIISYNKQGYFQMITEDYNNGPRVVSVTTISLSSFEKFTWQFVTLLRTHCCVYTALLF